MSDSETDAPMDPLLIVAATIVVALLLGVALKIVPVGHVVVTERLGKHQAILEPGMHFVIPVLGSMALDEALVSRPVIGTEVRRVMNWTTDLWGIRVNRVEVTAIDRPGSAPVDGEVFP